MPVGSARCGPAIGDPRHGIGASGAILVRGGRDPSACYTRPSSPERSPNRGHARGRVSRQINATVVVAGDPVLLADFRDRVNGLLDAEFGAPYRELHTAGRLDYRIKAPGVPYPQLVLASAEFPELVVEVAWENAAGGTGGTAKIQAGKLAEQAADPGAAAARCELRVERDGTLVLGLAARRGRSGEWLGYAVTANRHGLFRYVGGRDEAVLETSDGLDSEWVGRWTIRGEEASYAPLDPGEPIDDATRHELDRVASDFADEWIWFDEAPPAETAVERHRYQAYELKVNPANVKAAKIKTVLRESPGGGYALEMADPEGRAVAAALARHWLPRVRRRG